MIELDTREVARVARDVGEQETSRLSCHRRTPGNRRQPTRSVAGSGTHPYSSTRVKDRQRR